MLLPGTDPVAHGPLADVRARVRHALRAATGAAGAARKGHFCVRHFGGSSLSRLRGSLRGCPVYASCAISGVLLPCVGLRPALDRSPLCDHADF